MTGERRIRIAISYDGTTFHGWQAQPALPTIQGELERVVSLIEGSPVGVLGSGRTDAGVHALEQIGAFTLRNPIPCDNLRRAMNRLLPYTIRVHTADQVALDFHPRFHASSKCYEYRIFREEICPPFERPYVYHHPYPLNEAAMADAAALFLGEHDFRSFAASDPTDEVGRSRVRTIFAARLSREASKLVFHVEGSGFLKHMVRNLVGTLLEAGKGNVDLPRVAHWLAAPAGVKAGPTAPASGLFLVKVHYDFKKRT